MRKHVKCTNNRDSEGYFKKPPKEYNWMNGRRETHVYDVGDEELGYLMGLFDHVVVVEEGSFYEDE